MSPNLSSFFTKHLPYDSTTQSLILRYQVLFMFYLNFLGLLSSFLWIVTDHFFTKLPANYIIPVLIPFLMTSLITLRCGKFDTAALILLTSLHLTIFLCSQTNELVLCVSQLLLLLPGIGCFISSSKKIQILNFILCFSQNSAHILTINSVFWVTFTEEQTFQIFIFKFLSFPILLQTFLMVFFQKFIAKQLWQMAQSNFERTENITKELVQALEAKDTFISSFSHEIRNPLNSINGSIDYLSRIIKDAVQLEVLEHAKISAEVLLNLISNILDAAKLKSEKMELLHNETNPIEIIKKVLTVNSAGLARKGIFAQCFVDKHLPKKLILDSSRILQIIMNLFSNSIKFTPDNGRIQLHMVWCPLDKPQEELLQPIETKFPDKMALSSEESPMLKADLFNGHRHTSADHQQGTTAYSSRARSRATLDSLCGSPVNESCDEFNQNETRSRMDNIKHLHDCKKVKGMSQVYSFHSHINENYEILSLNNLGSKTLQSLDELSNCLVQDDKTGPRGYLKVQISDTGCGISEANLPKLFCAFSQADATISRHYGGTGLGLWISKQLCQKMGGNIAVYSKVDQGTTFVFYIEVANGMSAQTTPVNEFRSLKSKVRALIVDDHAYSRDLHKLLLEREGVEVHLAKDGREAVRKYETRCEDYYDFLMMDIQMPVMDGLKAAQMIRMIEKERETRNVDIYFVSGNYYGSEAEKLVENISNTQFLRKPINIEAVKKIVEIYGGLLKEHGHHEEGRRSERRSNSRRNTAFYNEWFKKRNNSENASNLDNRNLRGLIRRLSRISLT